MATVQADLRRDVEALGGILAELERRASFPTFPEWLSDARDEYRWDYPHFRRMQRALALIKAGEMRRAVFQVAIRHGKSEHNTISWAGYCIERDPTTRLIVGSYNQTQANKFSREIRRLVSSRGVHLSSEVKGVQEWETTAGGGIRALGAGAGAASVNADGIIIDDPVGSRQDAESQAKRDQVWDWLTNDILARAEPHTWVTVTSSRWHQDDPIGRLLDRQGSQWLLVDMPGVAEEGDELGREPGELLWPELRPRSWMEEERSQLGAYGFSSLIQLRPRPREGAMFDWNWWGTLEEAPQTGRMVRYWDTAGTRPRGGNHDPDFTAGVLMCRMTDGRTAIVDVARFRKSVAARDAEMERICREDRRKYGPRISWWVETESGIDGRERMQRLLRRLQSTGMAVYLDPRPTTKKEIRGEPLQSAAEAGNIKLCPGPWRDPFRAELSDFPNGVHDDQADAAFGAYAKLGVPESTVRFEAISI